MPPEPAPKQRAEAVVIIKAIGDAPDALPACEIAVEIANLPTKVELQPVARPVACSPAATTAPALMTWRVRACPTRMQHAWFAECLDHTRALYNAALEEREAAYRRARETYGREIPRGASVGRGQPAFLNNISQSRELTELRRDPAFARFPRRMQRWVLDKIETAYREMVKRRAAGQRCEMKFRGRDYWHTIGFDSPIDFRMRARGLYNAKATAGQTLRLRPDRALPPWEGCKAVTLTREGRRWFVNLTYEVPEARAPRPVPKRPVGINVGLLNAVARSDGALLPMARPLEAGQKALRRANRALSRCKKGSRRRAKVKEKLRALHAKITRQRTADLHRLSARLIHHFDAVAIDRLALASLQNLGPGGERGHKHRRHWRDHAPGRLYDMLRWKARRGNLKGAGRQRLFAEADPHHISRVCPACGAQAMQSLAARIHTCTRCGHAEHRDTAAAKIVLDRAGWGPGPRNPDSSSGGPSAGPVQDAAGNTAPVAPGHDAAATPLFIPLPAGVAIDGNPVAPARTRLHRRNNRMREESLPGARG